MTQAGNPIYAVLQPLLRWDSPTSSTPAHGYFVLRARAACAYGELGCTVLLARKLKNTSKAGSV